MVTDTKTALLDVAERAARACGFDGFSYADLAEAISIRKASLYLSFSHQGHADRRADKQIPCEA